MTTCMLVFGKANACALARWHSATLQEASLKIKGVSRASKGQKLYATGRARVHTRAAEESIAQRDLFVDILSANATKRDAKQFIARLKDHNKPPPGSQTSVQQRRRACPSVNLGTLYGPPRAIAETPQFVRDDQSRTNVPVDGELHLAMILLRDAAAIDDETLHGLATTIAQLVKLDMHILFILGSGQKEPHDISTAKAAASDQAARYANAIDDRCPHGARVVMDALQRNSEGHLELISPGLVLDPLQQGSVVIVPDLAYSKDWKVGHARMADVSAALVALTQQRQSSSLPMLLDRVVLLEPLGGIPSRARNDHAHVFINLQQELDEIEEELHEMQSTETSANQHLSNLRMLSSILSSLPQSSSAIVITPTEAAASSSRDDDATSSIGTGTRRQRNTLIHNLLTNKPSVSSSLPPARFVNGSSIDENERASAAPSATLVKKGMPLIMVPSIPRGTMGWQVPKTGLTSLDLENDTRVDLDRLVHLIDDSFRRKLDVRRYLDRISGRVAGLIIAGNYEGGAILTWERPPHLDSEDPARLVPYLDKFAVLQSSQGSAGVADIVFQAMVRTCFPQGVCWRSRSNNPVNKWYFERAAGTWTLPDTQWTMFWTGEGVVDDKQRFDDYLSVCKGIVPTWADDKAPD